MLRDRVKVIVGIKREKILHMASLKLLKGLPLMLVMLGTIIVCTSHISLVNATETTFSLLIAILIATQNYSHF